MIKEAIVKIVGKQDLTYDEAYAVMNEIMSGETTLTQNAAFLAALATKSAKAETTDEIAGCAAAMRDHAVKVNPGMDVLESVGTGGDGAQSFNISTTSALVAAAGGVKVAKHGNRVASSKCGTADCLEALGVNIQQSPARCVELLKEAGMCFFFAQKYHTSMKYVGAIRKELGVRTVFNILGPLTNPASPTMQLLGVYDEYLVTPLAQVLISLGVKRGMVVYGQDKLDELSMIAPTSENRIAMIAKEAEGFLYIVSSLGVTGTRRKIKTDLASIVEVVRRNPAIPCALGFGISTPEQAHRMAAIADGAIVGSAIVKQMAQYGKEAPAHVGEFVRRMKQAL